MALVSAPSQSPLTHCSIPYPYYTPRKIFFKSTFFWGRLGKEFSSLSSLFLISLDLIRYRQAKHTIICMTSQFPSLSDFMIAILNMFISVVNLSTLLLFSAGLRKSLTPFYVMQFFTEWKTIMKGMGPPSNTFLIKPMHL